MTKKWKSYIEVDNPKLKITSQKILKIMNWF